MNEPIRVLVVDDHRMFAEAIDLLIGGRHGIQVTQIVPNGEEALEACEADCPSVVLMDVNLPGMDGVDATREVLKRCPETRVVIMTAFQELDVIVRAMAAGACAYVPKSHAADDLIDTIRRAAAGEIVLPTGDLCAVVAELQSRRSERTRAARGLQQLTSRELEILQLLGEGKATHDIAAKLFISPFTVQSHVTGILTKLGAHSKLEAVTFALRHGLIHLDA